MINVYKLYHAAEFFYTSISRHLPNGFAFPPLQMAIEVTYRCNLKCEMCYELRQMKERNIRADTSQELSFAEIKSLIDQTPPWCLIIFTGGEPFSRSDIMEILDYATKKRRCHVVTNGALITPEIARRLVDMGLLSIGFSIDGDEATHDQIRGIQGTFHRAMGAIRAVREYRQEKKQRFPLLNLKTTISLSNVNQLSNIARIGREAGADHCTYQMMNNSLLISGLQLGDSLDPYFVPPAPIENFDIKTLETQLNNITRQQNPIPKVRFLPGIPIPEIIAHYANKLDIRNYSCGTPWSGINISASGEAFPCFNYRVGNLRETRLSQVWNGKRYRTFRKILKKRGLFQGCIGCCDLIFLESRAKRIQRVEMQTI